MMKPLRFYDFMRSAHVTRWHIVKTAANQSLAEHQFMVAMIALELFDRMVGVRDDEDFTMKIVMLALFHDMPETRTGDIPTPAKRMIRELMTHDPSAPDNIFKMIDAELMPMIPYINKPISAPAADFVKIADLIADAWWITENKVGIHSDIVAKANVRAMMEYVVTLDDNQKLGAGLVDAVNGILQELGMPYISQSLRDTPP